MDRASRIGALVLAAGIAAGCGAASVGESAQALRPLGATAGRLTPVAARAPLATLPEVRGCDTVATRPAQALLLQAIAEVDDLYLVRSADAPLCIDSAAGVRQLLARIVDGDERELAASNPMPGTGPADSNPMPGTGPADSNPMPGTGPADSNPMPGTGDHRR